MKKLLAMATIVTLVSVNALAFSLPSFGGGDTEEFVKCVKDTGLNYIANKKLNKDNVEVVSKEISIDCAAKTNIKDNALIRELASTTLKSLLD